MTLLDYIAFYGVAAVLVFQGTHAFAEPADPLGVVPAEVPQEPGRARLRGAILALYGYLSLLVALLSHAYESLCVLLPSMLALGVGFIAAYGLYVIFFNRKVEYLAEPSPSAHSDHH